MKLRITILKYHLWYLCQISLQIMLSPILICNFTCEITKLPWQPSERLSAKMATKFFKFYEWRCQGFKRRFGKPKHHYWVLSRLFLTLIFYMCVKIMVSYYAAHWIIFKFTQSLLHDIQFVEYSVELNCRKESTLQSFIVSFWILFQVQYFFVFCYIVPLFDLFSINYGVKID